MLLNIHLDICLLLARPYVLYWQRFGDIAYPDLLPEAVVLSHLMDPRFRLASIMISDDLKGQWMDVGESIVHKNAGEDFDRSRKLIKSSRYKCCLSECH